MGFFHAGRVFIRKHHVLLFGGAWLLINLVQAGLTELFDDEAYYWVYSRFPAWGYFDHPPMIALLIRAGYFLFRNEFGVRLFIVLMSTGTLFLIRALIGERNDRLFYAIACCLGALQIGGMMALPDVPLLFFTALFFWVYKRFTERTTLGHALMLGAVMALLLYSKYHGVLVIFFTLLSYPRILARFPAWLAGITAALLYIPHLCWQYAHGFPSLQYHLFDRNAAHYEPGYTLEYLLSQWLMAGPLAGILLLWAAWAHPPANRLEKALRYTMAGFYLFFGLSTWKGRVEANWTLPVFVSLIVLSHQYLRTRPRPARWIFRLAPLTLLIVLAGRIYMMTDTSRSGLIEKDEVHGNRAWVARIHQQSKGLPLVFIDSYQRASKYWFYSGIPAFCLNSRFYRRNNFSFWPLEDSLLGKKVYMVGRYDTHGLDEDTGIPGWESQRGKQVDSFFSFSRVWVRGKGEVISPQDYLPLFQRPPFSGMEILAHVFRNDSLIRAFPTGVFLKDIREIRFVFTPASLPGLPGGDYRVRYTIGTPVPGVYTLNSAEEPLSVPPPKPQR